MTTLHRPLGWLAAAVLVALALGCAKTRPAAPAGSPETVENDHTPAGPADGRQVFEQNCAKCHSVRGAAAAPAGGPGKKKGGGPDLSKVAADPEHTAEWLAEHVRDPRSHRPDSRMPRFGGKLSDDEIRAVAGYMTGLK
jgi:mono/diheme cytochrome c family protein